MAALNPGMKGLLWPPERELFDDAAPLLTVGLVLCLIVLYILAMRVEKTVHNVETESPLTIPDFRLTRGGDSANSLNPTEEKHAGGEPALVNSLRNGTSTMKTTESPERQSLEASSPELTPTKIVTAVPEAALDREKVVMKILQDARELIGWEVEVEGFGVGVVEETTKRLKGLPTSFKIRFDDGRVERLSLKRSRSKGKIPFKLRGATEVALRRIKEDYGGINISPAIGRRGSEIDDDSTTEGLATHAGK